MVASSQPVGEARPRRREAILDAATRLFADRGFAGVTVQEIADAAGTHKTTVLYHFDTKDALHEAVLDRALGRIAEVMGEFLAGPMVRERVAYLLDQILSFYAENPALARLLQRELLEPEGSEAYFRRFVDPIYLPALRSMEEAMDAGRMRRIDPAQFIHDTHVMLIGYFCHAPFLERLKPGFDPFSVDALIARREFLVDWVFRKIAPDRAEAGGETKRAKTRRIGGSP
jgi:AcrR family transcriptional regulator